jgi:hypothetical protein
LARIKEIRLDGLAIACHGRDAVLYRDTIIIISINTQSVHLAIGVKRVVVFGVRLTII